MKLFAILLFIGATFAAPASLQVGLGTSSQSNAVGGKISAQPIEAKIDGETEVNATIEGRSSPVSEAPTAVEALPSSETEETPQIAAETQGRSASSTEQESEVEKPTERSAGGRSLKIGGKASWNQKQSPSSNQPEQAEGRSLDEDVVTQESDRSVLNKPSFKGSTQQGRTGSPSWNQKQGQAPVEGQSSSSQGIEGSGTSQSNARSGSPSWNQAGQSGASVKAGGQPSWKGQAKGSGEGSGTGQSNKWNQSNQQGRAGGSSWKQKQGQAPVEGSTPSWNQAGQSGASVKAGGQPSLKGQSKSIEAGLKSSSNQEQVDENVDEAANDQAEGRAFKGNQSGFSRSSSKSEVKSKPQVSTPKFEGAEILKNDFSNSGTNYQWNFETSDGTKRFEEAEVTDVNGEPGIVMRGEYSYLGPDGNTYLVTYIADHNGFRPSGQHLVGLGIPSRK